MKSRHIKFCKQNTAMLIVLREITLQDINTTPKELKTERDCSHRQLFRPFWGSSVWRNNQRISFDEKCPRTLILSPDPELSTPIESRHTTCLVEGKRSVKLSSKVVIVYPLHRDTTPMDILHYSEHIW